MHDRTVRAKMGSRSLMVKVLHETVEGCELKPFRLPEDPQVLRIMFGLDFVSLWINMPTN